MYCRNCGKELRENASFCASCGLKLKEDKTNEIDQVEVIEEIIIPEQKIESLASNTIILGIVFLTMIISIGLIIII